MTQSEKIRIIKLSRWILNQAYINRIRIMNRSLIIIPRTRHKLLKLMQLALTKTCRSRAKSEIWKFPCSESSMIRQRKSLSFPSANCKSLLIKRKGYRHSRSVCWVHHRNLSSKSFKSKDERADLRRTWSMRWIKEFVIRNSKTSNT